MLSFLLASPQVMKGTITGLSKSHGEGWFSASSCFPYPRDWLLLRAASRCPELVPGDHRRQQLSLFPEELPQGPVTAFRPGPPAGTPPWGSPSAWTDSRDHRGRRPPGPAQAWLGRGACVVSQEGKQGELCGFGCVGQRDWRLGPSDRVWLGCAGRPAAHKAEGSGQRW